VEEDAVVMVAVMEVVMEEVPVDTEVDTAEVVAVEEAEVGGTMEVTVMEAVTSIMAVDSADHLASNSTDYRYHLSDLRRQHACGSPLSCRHNIHSCIIFSGQLLMLCSYRQTDSGRMRCCLLY
jgi:hypothetical protein